MAFSELLQYVGNFGRFQIIMSIMIVSAITFITTCNLVENFTAAIPAHRCYVHLLDNVTSDIKLTMNLTAEALLRISIPMGANQKQDQCRRFRQTQWQLLNSSNLTINNTELETEPCLDGWIYDQSVFTSTIVTQWDLVCDSQSLKPLSQFLFIVGYIIGSPTGGYFADKFGRKPILLAASLLFGLLGICSVFAPTFPVYCTLRFLMSISLATIYSNSFVILIEWIPTEARPMMMTVAALCLSTGQVLLAGLAYVFRDWHLLQFSICVPYVLFFLFLWTSVESARWLIISGKLEKALKEMKKIAYLNGKKDVGKNLQIERQNRNTLPIASANKEQFITRSRYFNIGCSCAAGARAHLTDSSWSYVLQSVMREELASLKHNSTKISIMTNPIMLKTTFCLCFLRFSAVFFLYGLLLDLQNLGSNMFLSLALLGAVDYPTKFLSFFVMRFLKRRPSVAFTLFTAGCSTLVNVFVPKDIPFLRLGSAIFGKGLIAIFFSMSTNYFHELVPTGVRSTVQGLITLCNGLAAALTSLILITRQYFEYLPMILCGIFPIVASFSVYSLPETLNLPLPDTMDDMKRRYKNYKKASTKEEETSDCLDTTEC
ncbi:solute carrier family 22 member 22-like [Tupaia chinensis]|uniref:solute carrier family 22 member 22-like n=1 Tax=Tupaia chinensis TaxID=246437 RepID=UPI000FFB6FF1|nr:solute carrier family 22 member 22-like [Tupaia chinensis]